jgi:hypothetical protein
MPERLLAASNAIDRPLPLRRARAWPQCLLARRCLAEAAVLVLVTALIYGLLASLP